MGRGPTVTHAEYQAIVGYALDSNAASVAELARATNRSARTVKRALAAALIDPVEFFGERKAL